MRNRILILWSLILICALAAAGQAGRKRTLIVAECGKYIPDVWCVPQTRETVAYHFEDGRLKNREVLLTGDPFPFEFHSSPVVRYTYQNRYLISDGGDVYDYDERKIIYRNNEGALLTQTAGETIRNLGVIKAIGNRLIVRLSVSNATAANRDGFFAYDLRTNKFEKIRFVGNFPHLGARNFSPDNKTIAVVERMKLVFYAVDESFHFRKLRTVSLGYAAPTGEDYYNSEEVTIAWGDNRSVLTVNKARMIVKINSGGVLTPFLKPKKSNNGVLTEISKDRFGNFFISPCGERDKCLINLQTRRLTEVQCDPLGNNFSAAPEKEMSNKEYWRSDFFYRGKLIGKNQSCYAALTSGEYIAFEDKDRWGARSAVKVWNAISKDWTEIKINWHNYGYIVGWIEGK